MEFELKVKRSSQSFVVGSRNFVRYADDFVILCTSYEEAKASLEDVKVALERRGLVVAPNKTRIVYLIDGFDFLGFTVKLQVKDGLDPKKIFIKSGTIDDTNEFFPFDTSNTLLLIKPSKKSIQNFQNKVKEVFMKNKQTKATRLIKELNPIPPPHPSPPHPFGDRGRVASSPSPLGMGTGDGLLLPLSPSPKGKGKKQPFPTGDGDGDRGWALSKNCWHINRTFHKLDNYVYNLCWRWMHRVHPQKNNGWLKKKYFKHLQKYGIDNKWVFTDPQTGIFLYQLKWTRN